MDIYLGRDDQQAGPFSQEQVCEMIRSSQIEKTDQMWSEGMSNWCCLGMRAEYQPVFQEVEAAQKAAEAAATPPPLPSELAPESPDPAAPAPAAAEAPDTMPTEPTMYRPGLRPIKKETTPEEDDIEAYVKPLVDAPKTSLWAAAWIDGLALWLCLWAISGVLLPKGLGITDLNDYGEGIYEAYDDPEFEAKLMALEERFYEDEEADWETYDAEYEALEQEWTAQRYANMDAGDRYLMGASTAEDDSKINTYYVIAALFSLLFSGFQYFNLATRGQTIGKMFMDIKLINECTRDAPGHNFGLIIHTFFPKFRLTDTAVVKA